MNTRECCGLCAHFVQTSARYEGAGDCALSEGLQIDDTCWCTQFTAKPDPVEPSTLETEAS